MILIDSIIIKNNEQYIDNIIKWINSNKQIKTELLYRKSKDGDSFDTFHQLCDNQGPILILIKGSEGFIIGGYTPLSWDNYADYKKDNDTFLFSLTNNETYTKIGGNTESIYFDKKYGPYFHCIGFNDAEKKNESSIFFKWL